IQRRLGGRTCLRFGQVSLFGQNMPHVLEACFRCRGFLADLPGGAEQLLAAGRQALQRLLAGFARIQMDEKEGLFRFWQPAPQMLGEAGWVRTGSAGNHGSFPGGVSSSSCSCWISLLTRSSTRLLAV